MIAVLAALLLQTDDVELQARLRGGAWASGGFEFEALLPTGKREVDGETLWLVGADAGVCFDDRWLLSAGADWSSANDLEVVAFHLSGGYRLRVGEMIHALPPFRCEFTAGVLLGTLDVDVSDFGDFDPGLGVRAGVTALFDFGDTFAIGAWVEARWIRFKYEEDTLDGDDYAGGGGVAAGVVVEARW